ncbi:hypothetical protein CO683_05515 [Bradyrhizobium ottawaense]|nr:hypothetical protein CO683_05515 [Bradyrhizobium ottawaense]
MREGGLAARPKHRHCEDLLRRGNPDCPRGDGLDCFAALAMTGRERAFPRPRGSSRRAVRWQEDAIIKRQPPSRCRLHGRNHVASTDPSRNRRPIRRARRALALEDACRGPA